MQIILSVLSAETTKLKYRPLYWLCLLIPTIVALVVFSVHFIDINNAVGIGDNPWEKLWKAGRTIFTVFLAIPFVIFLVSIALHLEHRSNTWKNLYATPLKRRVIILVKIFTLIVIMLAVICFLYISLCISGYTLNLFLPEMEFTYYSPFNLSFFRSLSHTFLALLGVVGIQYYLSFTFKSFLPPIATGVLGFILGLILGTINNPIAHYFPYSFPTIVQEDGMFPLDKVGVQSFGITNSVELASTLCFIIFIGLTLFFQNRKQIK